MKALKVCIHHAAYCDSHYRACFALANVYFGWFVLYASIYQFCQFLLYWELPYIFLVKFLACWTALETSNSSLIYSLAQMLIKCSISFYLWIECVVWGCTTPLWRDVSMIVWTTLLARPFRSKRRPASCVVLRNFWSTQCALAWGLQNSIHKQLHKNSIPRRPLTAPRNHLVYSCRISFGSN